MGEKKTKLIKRGGAVVALLAAAILMGSVNFNRNEAEASPSPADKAPAAEKTAAPKPDKAAPIDDKDYSDMAEDGFILLDGFLYEVGADGRIKRDFTDGMLTFDADGRYTSGDAELDAAVAALIVSQTAEQETRIDKLHRLYDYIRDNMEYVGYVNNSYSYAEPNGADGWGNSVAKEALQNLAGNCYYYNSAFAVLARGLGYQAYIVTSSAVSRRGRTAGAKSSLITQFTIATRSWNGAEAPISRRARTFSSRTGRKPRAGAIPPMPSAKARRKRPRLRQSMTR